MTTIRELLTAAQLRHVESVLRYVERSLDETERDLGIGAEAGVLYHISSDVAPDERDRLRQSIAEARGVLAMLADRLRLDAGSSDLRRSIVARFSILAIDARSIASEGLRGYGPVHRDVAKSLDACVESLAQALEGVLRCMDERTKP